jgi:23S rRNA (pseudouridine1915-N3)-methyltransferase
MRLHILAVGQRLPTWAQESVGDYLGRLPRDFQVQVQEARAPARQGQPVERLRAEEAARLRNLLPRGALVVALDERGRDWTSAEFARALGAWRDQAREVAFLIGGPDGLEPELLATADQKLRLSSMTLPHALARVVLAEQIYRAWSLLADHPYHRA